MARISESCVPLLAAISVMVMVIVMAFVIIDAVHDGIVVVTLCKPYEDLLRQWFCRLLFLLEYSLWL